MSVLRVYKLVVIYVQDFIDSRIHLKFKGGGERDIIAQEAHIYFRPMFFTTMTLILGLSRIRLEFSSI